MAIGAGTDIAIKSAEVVLINSAIALSKATIRNIKQNPAPAIFMLENIRTCEDTACPVSEKLFMKEETMMETVIKVEGMMCSHCKARVEKVCKAVPGTVDAVVDLAAKTVTVTGTADVAALKQAITDADYTVVE